MSEYKKQAIDIIDRLHQENRIGYQDYLDIHDGLDEMETLRDRDEVLEELWGEFADVPMNPDTECIEERFMGWGPGIHREEIWHWFDERHSKGVAYLLYGGAEDYVPETKRLYGLRRSCFERESQTCQFNHGGECRFALVHERKPRITDDDGCIDYDYREGDD